MPVLAIREVRRGSRARVLSFDGIDERTTSADVVRSLFLEAGEYPSQDVVLEQIDRAEPGVCLERALRLLNYRERAIKEMHDRLLDDGYAISIVEPIILRLKELEFLDDARFAGCLTRSKQAAGWGRSRILQELRRRGVSEESVVEALSQSDDETEYERALAIARKRPAFDRATQEKAVSRLVRKGYGLDIAVRAVRTAREEHQSALDG